MSLNNILRIPTITLLMQSRLMKILEHLYLINPGFKCHKLIYGCSHKCKKGHLTALFLFKDLKDTHIEFP